MPVDVSFVTPEGRSASNQLSGDLSEDAVTCRQLTDFIVDYLEGLLSTDQRRLFEEHLAECEDCVHYLDSYRKTMLVLHGMPQTDEEPAMPESLVKAILKSARVGS